MNPRSQTVPISPRFILAFAVAAIGVCLAVFGFAAPNNAGSGTISAANPHLTYSDGPFLVSNATAQAGPPDCTAPMSCSDFALTVAVTDASKQVRVSVGWPVSSADFDVYVYSGSPATATLVGSSASSADPEVVILPAASAVYTIRVVPFVPAGQTYSANVSLESKPTAPVGSTATPPRYQDYPPNPSSLAGAGSSGEPSVGVDWNPNVASLQNIQPQTPGTPPMNGIRLNAAGVAFFTADLNEYRVNFDDCSSPAGNLWQDVTNATESLETLDPIGFVDHQLPGETGAASTGAGLGRVFQSQLVGATSITSFSDTDGNSYSQSQGSGQPAGVDHQTLGGGPYAPTNPTSVPPVVEPPHPLYPHQIYYASQDIGTAFAARSDNGGQTFGPGVAMYNITQCGGLHGHIKVGPDGTAYVPNKSCGSTSAVAVSRDNGVTWTVKPIPGSTPGSSDPSVGIGADNTVYFGYQDGSGHPHIAVSTNHGDTWHDVDVSQGLITHCVFPEVVAGDGDRAAFGFLGTNGVGSPDDTNGFTGVWYFYIATTFDRGQTYTLVDATNGDPVQVGSVCTAGTTCGADRNLLDFNDLQIDKEGRVLAAMADGCVAPACNASVATAHAPPYNESRSALATVIRQSGGPRLLHANDPAEPAAPGAPRVDSVVKTGAGVHLAWSAPDNGGSPLTGYNVYRKTGVNGTYARLGSAPTVTTGCPNCKTTYDDATATDSTVQYFYKVTAVNTTNGESPSCGEFTPGISVVVNPCSAPGVLALNDLNADGSDNDSGANTPPDPRVNIRQLYISEPFFGAGVNQLVFTMQLAPSPGGTPPPSSQWFIVYQQQNPPDPANFDRWYVAMKSDATGALTYEYGKFGVPLNATNPNPNQNTPVKIGNADSGSYNVTTGVVTIVLSDAHADPNGLSAGQSLSQLNVRTYFGRPDAGPKMQDNASDITSNGIYTLVGNASCAPNTAPTAVLTAYPVGSSTNAPPQGDPPLAIQFDASSSSDPDAGDSVASYTFDFGDGTAPVTQASPTIQHTYTSNGHFAARLTVSDTHGKVSNNVATAEIEVELPLDRVVSEKMHGSVMPAFDVILFDPTVHPDGTGEIECRTEGNGYTVIYSFGTEFAVTGQASSTPTVNNGATVASHGPGPGSNQYQIHLTGVTNAQRHTITLTGVPVTNSNKGNAPATLNNAISRLDLLVGDVNGNGSVTNADVSAVKAQVGAPAAQGNFREDVNANGTITNNDVTATKAQVGSALP